MDELDPAEGETRPSVKELVARIQQQQTYPNGNNSESSDDEDQPLRLHHHQGPMGDSNLVPTPNYENIPAEATARTRTAVYSPTLIDSNTRYIEPIVKIQESNIRYNETYRLQYYEQEMPQPPKYFDHSVNARLAKLRVLDSTKEQLDGGNHHDNADRDTNNDSGYSTKVYGSSKGNSPSLSGQIDGGECLGASSLVWPGGGSFVCSDEDDNEKWSSWPVFWFN